MADYVVGDIQGCFNELQALLTQVAFNPGQDTLYCVGDIVARGPDSLKALRFLHELGQSAHIALGNHDLHLLATHYLGTPLNPSDKLDALLASKERDALLAYLLSQPLVIDLPKYKSVITHAGVHPDWDLTSLKAHGASTMAAMRENPAHTFSSMYGNTPTRLNHANSQEESRRFTINALTRMRFLNDDFSLEFQHKCAPNQAPKLLPWFKAPSQLPNDYTVIFGHWAALMGQTYSPHHFGLDTGCVWGQHMTLMELGTKRLLTQKALP